jgi:CubicO group peptidase (beta-lactamase class C family)
MAVALVVASLVLAHGTMAATSPSGPSARTHPTAASDAAIDAYLTRARDQLGLPGLAVAIVRTGSPTHLFVIGRADEGGRPITPQTPFLLASLSKAFTATAVMQLAESGRVDLDAPVRRYLPWFAVADTDASARMTVRELLNQTSGLTTREGTAYQTSDDQDVGALERGVRRLSTAVLGSAPGMAYAYSNANYDVLGLIVQTVSGEPFDRYLADHIYGPLGMTHSHATRDAAHADGLAEGYYAWFGRIWRPTYMTLPRAGGPSATTYSSAEDMGRWVAANLAGGVLGTARILSPSGMGTLHQATARIDDFHGYAMGWQTRPLWEALDPTAGTTAGDGYRLPLLVEHSGGWPNAHTYVGFVPAQGWGVVLLINAGDEVTYGLGQVEQNLLRLMAGQDPSVTAPPADAPVSGRYVIVLGLLIAELASLAWAVRVIRRRRARPAPDRSRRATIVFGVVALALDALVVWLYLVYYPDRFDADFLVAIRSAPDAALLVMPALVLALVWAPIRTLMLASTLALPRPGTTARSAPST